MATSKPVKPLLETRSRRSLCRFVLGVFLASGLISTPAISQDLYPQLMPDPSYSPEDVVGIQMQALGSNNIPFDDAGIELTFRFASPGNRAMTGPLDRFKTLFDIPAYAPMINHVELRIGEPSMVGTEALVPVVVTDGKGNRAGYMFTLAQQSIAPFEDCWMTKSVVRMSMPNSGSTIM